MRVGWPGRHAMTPTDRAILTDFVIAMIEDGAPLHARVITTDPDMPQGLASWFDGTHTLADLKQAVRPN
jgi:hypothetical protein